MKTGRNMEDDEDEITDDQVFNARREFHTSDVISTGTKHQDSPI